MTLLLLLLSIVVVIGGLAYLGTHYQRKLKREAPDRQEVRPLKWFEVITASSGAILLFVCIGAYELAPDSQLGVFLHQPYGIAATVIGYFFAIFLWGLLVAFIKTSERNKQNGV